MTQAKDIPELPILEFLERMGPDWCFLGLGDARCVSTAMPMGTPYKVALAKMAALIKRGLVDGCPCGCRGDFGLTEAGRKHLREATR